MSKSRDHYRRERRKLKAVILTAESLCENLKKLNESRLDKIIQLEAEKDQLEWELEQFRMGRIVRMRTVSEIPWYVLSNPNVNKEDFLSIAEEKCVDKLLGDIREFIKTRSAEQAGGSTLVMAEVVIGRW